MLTLMLTAPQGVEPLLATEATALGLAEVRETRGGVRARGDIAAAYRLCLWSRLASRVLVVLGDDLPCADDEALLAAATGLPWTEHLRPDRPLWITVSGSNDALRDTRYSARRIKDGIADHLRERGLARPVVERTPDAARIQAVLRGNRLTVSLDLCGAPLHERGYRQDTGRAPLKENLAAALLAKLDWPRSGPALVDPCCGSGTLLIEGALMAGDAAPGLWRETWAHQALAWAEPDAWAQLRADALARRDAGLARLEGPFLGRDIDPRAVAVARENAARAGLADHIRIEQGDLAACRPPPERTGLLICNPPYGERLELTDDALYRSLGDVLTGHFQGWRAGVLVGDAQFGKVMGLKASRVNTFYNGPLKCSLLSFEVRPQAVVDRAAADIRAGNRKRETALAEGGDAFLNRVRKNQKHLGRWARREGIEAYRVYDADLPEFAVAVDVYADRLHVQEYAPPASVDPEKAERRLQAVLTLLPEALDVAPEHIALKVRERQKGAAQYTRQTQAGERLVVREGPARLEVNLTEYLDTGLFLDHRPLRARVRAESAGKRVLNLFCYTASITVHAALGGASRTMSVDLSNTYLDWAARNLALNGFSEGDTHQLVRADCLAWLASAQDSFDLIVLDPPTFSNSKRMEDVLDVQRDHPRLIRLAAARLAEGGVLYFSTNHRRFKLDGGALTGLVAEDITAATIPEDFKRNPRIHQCWRVTRA